MPYNLPENRNSFPSADLKQEDLLFKTTLLSEKGMPSKNAHYESQLSPFNFTLNISIGKLIDEIM